MDSFLSHLHNSTVHPAAVASMELYVPRYSDYKIVLPISARSTTRILENRPASTSLSPAHTPEYHSHFLSRWQVDTVSGCPKMSRTTQEPSSIGGSSTFSSQSRGPGAFMVILDVRFALKGSTTNASTGFDSGNIGGVRASFGMRHQC